MISLEQIAQHFPPHLALQKQAMLRVYLQCVILEILFESPFARKFSFLGGTCLRLVHAGARFSCWKILVKITCVEIHSRNFFFKRKKTASWPEKCGAMRN